MAGISTQLASRSIWIDRLRTILTVLVIGHHAMITYGASGSWFFKATEATSIPLTFLAAVNQSFFMGLFFLLSGYLIPASVARKGRMSFLLDRALRLGVPVLVFGFVIGPLTVALATSTVAGLPEGFIHGLFIGDFVLGPMWFPAALMLFCAISCLGPLGFRSGPSSSPKFRNWFFLALITGLGALLVRQIVPVGETVLGFQLGYFVSYAVLFAVGLRAAKEGWIDHLPGPSVLSAIICGLVALPILPIVLLSVSDPEVASGFSLPAVTYALWEPLVALGIIPALIVVSHWRGHRAGAFWTEKAGDSYGAFILHAPLLVVTSRLLEWTETGHGMALILSVLLTTICAFALSRGLRRFAVVRRII